jgi:hypothetical protein
MLWAVERDCILMSCIYTIYALLLTSSVQSGSIYWHRKYKKRINVYGFFSQNTVKMGGGNAKFKHEKVKCRERVLFQI